MDPRFLKFRFFLTFVGLACFTRLAIGAGEIGTVSSVDAGGRLGFIPWGGTSSEAKVVPMTADAVFTIGGAAVPAQSLKPGMWIELEQTNNGDVRRASAGEFLAADGGRIVIFRGLPAAFLQRDVKDWYTNEAGGVQFKVQFMRGSGDPKITGANLRPSKYAEPAEGFVFHLPAELRGAVVNFHGAKPGVTTPDAEGKITINKETVIESYFNHPKNPVKPELGATSGLTELTLRKLPKSAP
ncbi:MAG TPA: hypothetical protein VGO11_02375 [Chthoniobacteraceae bacterium]|jgi:hypothetical protein|nr:hypothetical protein [Chthoniobacteraceae bacterium]